VFRYSSVRRDPSEYTTGDWQGQPSQTESRSGLIGDEMYGARVGAGLGLGVGVAVLTVVIIAMGNGN